MSRIHLDRKRKDIAFAIRMGWEFVRVSGSGHLIFAHPRGGPRLVMSHSPGGGRGASNGIAWIKKNTPREDTA